MPKLSLQRKIKKLIEVNLKDGKAELETLAGGQVCGHVISPEFRRKSYERRRARIRNILDCGVEEGQLTQRDLLQVSTLLTYTPEEWSIGALDS